MGCMPPVLDPRRRILFAAERLIAEQGISVSLREIAIAAGQKNNSAVHYYFGNRDALIKAIVDEHQPAMESERLVMLARGPVTEVPDLVRVMVTPMFSVPYAQGSTHYARCLEKIRDHPSVTRELTDEWPAIKLIVESLDRRLAELPTSLRMARLFSLVTVMFGLLADVERTDPQKHRDQAEQNVMDMMSAMLTAKVTAPNPT